MSPSRPERNPLAASKWNVLSKIEKNYEANPISHPAGGRPRSACHHPGVGLHRSLVDTGVAGWRLQPRFAEITAQRNSPRGMQMSLRYFF
ncbi:MAG: hypothetical protein AAB225_03960 [Acidobacteriota bacterium]